MAIVEIERMYFGMKVIVSRDDRSTSPYPWLFRIEEPSSGVTHHYGGIQNRCDTHISALKRGWWRAKWLHDGTYVEKYMTIGITHEPEGNHD